MDFCKVGRQTGRPIIGHHKNCWNLSVFNYPAFYPLKANQRQQLFESKDDNHWRELFKDSYSVHFFGQLTSTRYGSLMSGKAIQGFFRVWRTGNNTAYDFLGQRYCPLTYGVQGNLDLS